MTGALVTLMHVQSQVPVVCGYSRENRPIVLRKLGTGDYSVLILGGVHGDELPSWPLVEDLYEDVRSHPTLINGLSVYFVFQVNPDGVAAGTRTNAAGVDINRNMEFDWQPAGRSARMNPGPAPYSEPETVVLRQVIEQTKPARILSVHGFADILDFDTDKGQDIAIFMSLSNNMKVATIGYPTPGSLGRFCRHHNIPLVTLEVARGKTRQEHWNHQQNALWTFVLGRPQDRPLP